MLLVSYVTYSANRHCATQRMEDKLSLSKPVRHLVVALLDYSCLVVGLGSRYSRIFFDRARARALPALSGLRVNMIAQ